MEGIKHGEETAQGYVQTSETFNLSHKTLPYSPAVRTHESQLVIKSQLFQSLYFSGQAANYKTSVESSVRLINSLAYA